MLHSVLDRENPCEYKTQVNDGFFQQKKLLQRSMRKLVLIITLSDFVDTFTKT